MMVARLVTILGLCSLTEAIALSTRNHFASSVLGQQPMIDVVKELLHHEGQPTDFGTLETRCDFVNTLATWQGPTKSHIKLFIFGDSLMRMQFETFCSATKEKLPPSLHTSVGVQAKDLYDNGMPVRPQAFPAGKMRSYELETCELPLPGQGKLTAAYIGEREGSISRLDLVEQMYERLGTPDILYFDSGMHFLHLVGAPGEKWDNYNQWLNYEENFHDFLDHHLIKKAPKLAFMFSHAICDSKYISGWATTVKSIKHDKDKAAKPCEAYMEDYWFNPKQNDTTSKYIDHTYAEKYDGGVHNQCKEGFFISDGVKRLNKRAKGVLAHHQSITTVDGYQITLNQCEKTMAGDGRHYPELAFVELAQLWKGIYGSNGRPDAQYKEDMLCE